MNEDGELPGQMDQLPKQTTLRLGPPCTSAGPLLGNQEGMFQTSKVGYLRILQ